MRIYELYVSISQMYVFLLNGLAQILSLVTFPDRTRVDRSQPKQGGFVANTAFTASIQWG